MSVFPVKSNQLQLVDKYNICNLDCHTKLPRNISHNVVIFHQNVRDQVPNIPRFITDKHLNDLFTNSLFSSTHLIG